MQRFTADSAVQFEVSSSAPQPLSCVLLNGVSLNITSVSVGAVEVCGDRSGRSCADYVWYDLKRQADGANEPASTADLNLMAISLGNETLNAGQAQWVSLSYTGVLGAWPTSTEGLLQSAPYVSTENEPMAGLDTNGLQVRGWPARGWLGGWLHVREVVGRGSCGQAGLQMAGACKLRVSPCSREGSMGCTLLAAAAAQQTGTQAWGW